MGMHGVPTKTQILGHGNYSLMRNKQQQNLNGTPGLNYSCHAMAQRIPEINGASIVLAGSFNPKIFQPEWFARQNLIPQAEAEAATIVIMVPQLCDFETDRFKIQVTTDRFFALAKADANPAPLRDLVLGTFYVLEHTPATAVGLNRQMHFSLPSEEAWHKVGDRLAPKEGWSEAVKGHVGMLSLAIQVQQEGEGREGAKLVVKVEPSPRVKFGVYFDTNDHHPARTADGLKSLMEIVQEKWEDSYNNAAEIANRILDWTSK